MGKMNRQMKRSEARKVKKANQSPLGLDIRRSERTAHIQPEFRGLGENNAPLSEDSDADADGGIPQKPLTAPASQTRAVLVEAAQAKETEATGDNGADKSHGDDLVDEEHAQVPTPNPGSKRSTLRSASSATLGGASSSPSSTQAPNAGDNTLGGRPSRRAAVAAKAALSLPKGKGKPSTTTSPAAASPKGDSARPTPPPPPPPAPPIVHGFTPDGGWIEPPVIDDPMFHPPSRVKLQKSEKDAIRQIARRDKSYNPHAPKLVAAQEDKYKKRASVAMMQGPTSNVRGAVQSEATSRKMRFQQAVDHAMVVQEAEDREEEAAAQRRAAEDAEMTGTALPRTFNEEFEFQRGRHAAPQNNAATGFAPRPSSSLGSFPVSADRESALRAATRSGNPGSFNENSAPLQAARERHEASSGPRQEQQRHMLQPRRPSSRLPTGASSVQSPQAPALPEVAPAPSDTAEASSSTIAETMPKPTITADTSPGTHRSDESLLSKLEAIKADNAARRAAQTSASDTDLASTTSPAPAPGSPSARLPWNGTLTVTPTHFNAQISDMLERLPLTLEPAPPAGQPFPSLTGLGSYVPAGLTRNRPGPVVYAGAYESGVTPPSSGSGSGSGAASGSNPGAGHLDKRPRNE
ncbi:unnamed protein product [Discula destructiva]